MKIKYFGVFLMVYSLVYLVIAYVELNFNPLTWDYGTRVGASITLVLVTLMCFTWVAGDTRGYTYDD